MCLYLFVFNIIGQPSLTNEDLLVNGKILNMEIVPMQMRVYRSCCHPVAAMILVMYVDNNSIRQNCEELVQEFEKFVKQDGRINLHREGELDWSLLVRYTSDKSLALLVVAKRLTLIVSCSSTAWKMLMFVSCR